MNFKTLLPAAAALAVASIAVPAAAAIPIYSPKGTPNAAVYSFAAPASGILEFYYLGGLTVSYRSALYLSVNGSVLTPVYVDNKTTPVGTYFAYGPVSSGDTLEFYLDLIGPPQVSAGFIGSTPGTSLPVVNDDGLTQVFSSYYGGGDYGTPSGDYTYVAFEDVLGYADPVRPNDFDYNDFRFAYTVDTYVPEPATWAMMVAGFGLMGFALRRRKSALTSVAA